MAALDKFGVPNGPGRGGIIQPKYKYRFRVTTLDFGPLGSPGLELTQQVMNVTKPKISHEIVTVHAYNSRAYFAGKHEWDTITLVVRDDVTNSVSRLVSGQVQKQLDHFEQTGYKSGMNYKFDMFLDIMGGGNDEVLEKWDIEGCFLSNIDWGDMDYSTSDVQTISMTIRFDNAVEIFTMESPAPDNAEITLMTGGSGS